MNAADLLMAAQALRLLTEAHARYAATGRMDAEQLMREWERVSAESRRASANLTAALDEAQAARDFEPDDAA